MNEPCKSPGDGQFDGANATIGSQLPLGFVELAEITAASIEHGLGYFRDERFAIFGYCPGGGEVIWRDGHSSGFATGGWRMFLQEIVPLALRRGANLGSIDSVGTHVVLIDRRTGVAYAAVQFLHQFHGLPPVRRPCLCGLVECAGSPSCRCAKLTDTHGQEHQTGTTPCRAHSCCKGEPRDEPGTHC